jgi:hypothetical protein
VTTQSIASLAALSRRFDLFDHAVAVWDGPASAGFHPPLAVAGPDLVWGFPLVEAAERAGKTELPVVVLAAGDPAALLTLALQLENRCGRYSYAEQERLRAFMTAAGILDRLPSLAPLLTAESAQKWLLDTGVYAGAGPELKRVLDARLLDLKTAARVRELPGPVFASLLAEAERFSFSERRFFTLALWEITRRDRLDEAGSLALLRELLGRDEPVRAVRERRFPELSGLEKRFRETAAPLARRGVTVKPPEGFEGGTLEFGFRASSRDVCETRLAALKESGELIDRLFGLL